jgi:hypothetical protein
MYAKIKDPFAYFTGTISPVLISLAAAATLEGVRRFKRPSYVMLDVSIKVSRKRRVIPTQSSLPQTHAAPGGAPCISGSSLRVGNLGYLSLDRTQLPKQA